MDFDKALFDKYADQVREGLAQMIGMVTVATSPGGGAIQPAPAQPGVGEPLPGTDPMPDKNGASIWDVMDFLDDHRVADFPGEMISYIQTRGGYQSNVAHPMAKEWAPLYPAALTYCQTLRGIEQGVDPKKEGVVRWDGTNRTWLDVATGKPFNGNTTPDPMWGTTWADRVRANRPA